ncbi:MAG: phosphoglycolate phosphatase [Gammaproteobacteria bacterium]|nr:MAG: phosphoglycolate phosphatase [Gammaproteobacteria bacterium]
MNKSGYKLVAFDLDGTLVDSALDLAYAGNEMLAELGLESVTDDQVRHWVGNGAPKLVQRMLTRKLESEQSHPLLEKALSIFLALYEKNICHFSELYEGVNDGLENLQKTGVKIACITNKPLRFVRPILAQLGIEGYFEQVVGGDSYPHIKPHPMPLLKTADYFGCPANEAVMIGDSNNDILAARAAGFGIICVNYGYNQGRRIEDFHPDRVINSVAEIPQYLKVI